MFFRIVVYSHCPAYILLTFVCVWTLILLSLCLVSTHYTTTFLYPPCLLLASLVVFFPSHVCAFFCSACIVFICRYALIFSMDNVSIQQIHVHMHIPKHIVHLMQMVLLLFVLIMLKENVLVKHANIFIHLIILLHN